MDTLFTYFSSENWMLATLIIIAVALVLGAIFTFLISLRLRGSKGFFVTSILMPGVIASIIAVMTMLLTSTTTTLARIATIAVALGLIRFRSVNAKSEELLVLFVDVAIGLIAGLGYVLLAAIVTLIIALLYLALSYLNIFNNKRFGKEKLLKITIPESLEYSDVFNETFTHYLKSNELVGVKTTGMGSLFKLSYKIELKDIKEEKEFIDELRTKNGNLEISVLPYTGDDKSL